VSSGPERQRQHEHADASRGLACEPAQLMDGRNETSFVRVVVGKRADQGVSMSEAGDARRMDATNDRLVPASALVMKPERGAAHIAKASGLAHAVPVVSAGVRPGDPPAVLTSSAISRASGRRCRDCDPVRRLSGAAAQRGALLAIGERLGHYRAAVRRIPGRDHPRRDGRSST
jgi:hypothetical protein